MRVYKYKPYEKKFAKFVIISAITTNQFQIEFKMRMFKIIDIKSDDSDLFNDNIIFKFESYINISLSKKNSQSL